MTDYTRAILDTLLAEATADIARKENPWYLYWFYKREISNIGLTNNELKEAVKQLCKTLKN